MDREMECSERLERQRKRERESNSKRDCGVKQTSDRRPVRDESDQDQRANGPSLPDGHDD